MEKTLSLFPLNLIVYPGEDLNLHVFEPRYRQLINECLEEERTFGIPAFINNKLPGYGTEMHVTTLHKRYPDGRMDIKSKGLGRFPTGEFRESATRQTLCRWRGGIESTLAIVSVPTHRP